MLASRTQEGSYTLPVPQIKKPPTRFRDGVKSKRGAGLFGCRVASATASSLARLGTACGVLREQCSLVEPMRFRDTFPFPQIKKPPTRGGFFNLAEREGFEPSVGLHLRLISSQVHSTTLPPLQMTILLFGDA